MGTILTYVIIFEISHEKSKQENESIWERIGLNIH